MASDFSQNRKNYINSVRLTQREHPEVCEEEGFLFLCREIEGMPRDSLHREHPHLATEASDDVVHWPVGSRPGNHLFVSTLLNFQNPNRKQKMRVSLTLLKPQRR